MGALISPLPHSHLLFSFVFWTIQFLETLKYYFLSAWFIWCHWGFYNTCPLPEEETKAEVSGTSRGWMSPPLLKGYSILLGESESCTVMSNSLQLHGPYSSWYSPGQNIGVGNLSLLQGIFPTQGLNPGLPNCRWILYQLHHYGSPRILVWVSLFQQIFLTQESNQGLLHCKQILHQLSWGKPSYGRDSLKKKIIVVKVTQHKTYHSNCI